LRVYGANLPVCSAQASFLCNRAIPILDRFVAQFYSLTLSPEILHFSKSNMVDVLRNINTVRFMIEDDGTHRCIPRLAVYGSRNYARNQDLFVFELLPELHRIAKELNDSLCRCWDGSFCIRNTKPRLFSMLVWRTTHSLGSASFFLVQLRHFWLRVCACSLSLCTRSSNSSFVLSQASL
jgi:hypothetical protein